MGEIGNYFIHCHGLDNYPIAAQEHFLALFALPRSSLMTLPIEKFIWTNGGRTSYWRICFRDSDVPAYIESEVPQ